MRESLRLLFLATLLQGCTNTNLSLVPTLLFSQFILALCPVVLLVLLILLSAIQLLVLLEEDPTTTRRTLGGLSSLSNILLGLFGLYASVAPWKEGRLSLGFALLFFVWWLVPLLLGGTLLLRVVKPKS